MGRKEIQAALRALREWPGRLGSVKNQTPERKRHPTVAKLLAIFDVAPLNLDTHDSND